MTHPLRTSLGALMVAALLPAAATAEERYGYVRTLAGSASISTRDAAGQEADTNQPIMVGDRIEVSSRSRVELELSDRNLARLDGGSDLTVERSAFSADGSDRDTLLRLDAGDLQLVVNEDALGDELPRVDTPNATLYVGGPGVYRITTDGDWTEVTVRSGRLEVRTATESMELEAGDALRVEGADWPTLARVRAAAEDDFDLWGRELDGEVAQADLRYVEPEMRYTTASLRRYGSWVSVGSRYAWHPYGVDNSWRPYWDGRWTYTPSGLTWVSNEPWGWSTYHYGSWDYAPGYGWVWYPGSVYSPAWVYWYWGPSHVGWCPSGYYSRHYGRSGFDGFRYGVYGWAGGGWGGFLDWSFVPTRYFGRHDQRRYCHSGSAYRDRFGLHDVPRGIITTDTRRITPDRWQRPTEVIDVLRRTPLDTRPGGRIAELPDVSGFVDRRKEIAPEVRYRLAELPRRTDVTVDVPASPDAGVRLSPRQPGRVTSIGTPRTVRPDQGGERPRAVVPRAGGAPDDDDAQRVWRSRTQPRPDRGQPEAVTPRTVTPQPRYTPRVAPRDAASKPDDSKPSWRSETSPRRVQPPARETTGRQGWRDQAPPTRRPESAPRVEPGERTPRVISSQPRVRQRETPPSDPPVVRRVIDGVRSNGGPPSSRPEPRYQPRPERAPERYSQPPSSGGQHGGSSAQPRSQPSRGEARGQERSRSEDRKPPKERGGG